MQYVISSSGTKRKNVVICITHPSIINVFYDCIGCRDGDGHTRPYLSPLCLGCAALDPGVASPDVDESPRFLQICAPCPNLPHFFTEHLCSYLQFALYVHFPLL